MFNYQNLLIHRVTTPIFVTDKTSINLLISVIKDSDYINFIENTNGGYFYGFSLHLYGLSLEKCNDLLQVNAILAEKCSVWQNSFFSIGQDIFGNQFVFFGKDILFLNLETGESEMIASSFLEWIEIISENVAYFSGCAFSKLLSNKQGVRLCPKLPFVLGGKYEEENLYSMSFPEYLQYYSDIEKQIRDLPDNTEFEISVID